MKLKDLILPAFGFFLMMAILAAFAGCGGEQPKPEPPTITCICEFRRSAFSVCAWETKIELCSDTCTIADIIGHTERINKEECGE